jgi:hypothetical protein
MGYEQVDEVVDRIDGRHRRCDNLKLRRALLRNPQTNSEESHDERGMRATLLRLIAIRGFEGIERTLNLTAALERRRPRR